MNKSSSSMVAWTTFGVLCLISTASAWGGLFNRYNPALMSELGGYTGGHGGYAKEFATSRGRSEPSVVEELLEAEEEAVTTCSGKKCTANEHCCEDHVCIDDNELTGRCFPVWGKKQGEACVRDSDCESGFLCVEDGYRRTCQAVVQGNAGLGEDCRTSSDCNISKGLCCKLQRKARGHPKKTCSYFADSAMCVGPVATNQILTQVEHTAGEKRLSGHPDDYLHFRK